MNHEMDQLNLALECGLRGDFEALHAIQRQLMDKDSFYAFYDHLFKCIPKSDDARVLAASLLVPFLQELQNAYNFADECFDMIFTAAQNCVKADAPQFARVIVMSLARKESVIGRFFAYAARLKSNSAHRALLQQLSLHVARFPERYDEMIAVLAREPQQLRYLLSGRNLLMRQLEQICSTLDIASCDFETVALLCQVALPRVGLEKVSQYIYAQLRAGNLLASTLLREAVRCSGAPAFLLAQSDDFGSILTTVCEGIFAFPDETQLNFVEWLTGIYDYCNQLYACEMLETATMSRVEQLEKHVDALINAFFSSARILKHKSVKNMFSALVGIYQTMHRLTTAQLVADIFRFVDQLPPERQMVCIYVFLQPKNYPCAEEDINAIFVYLMAKLFDCEDFEFATVCMKIVQDIGLHAEKARLRIRLQQTHIGTFISILQKTLDSMAQSNDEYFYKNIGSKMQFTIYNYFKTNDLEMYSSFETPPFRNSEFMIPELLIYFNVTRMSNFQYLHILFSQQRLNQFLDSADLFTLREFAEFAPFMSANIDYISPQRLSGKCITMLYEMLGYYINEVFNTEIDYRVAALVCALFGHHYAFAVQFFQNQAFVDYIIQSAAASAVSLQLLKFLVAARPACMKSYAFAFARSIIFNQPSQAQIQDAVDILAFYCSSKEEVIEGVFGGFAGLAPELSSFYTDADCTDGCDRVEGGVFDIKEIISKTLNQIYE